MPKFDFQIQFSMSKVIWIFLIFFSLKNTKLGAHFLKILTKQFIFSNSQNSIILFDCSWYLANNLSNFGSLPWKVHNQYCHIAIAYLNPPVSKTWLSLILIKQCNWRFIGSWTPFVDIPCSISINSVVFDCKWFFPIPPVTQSFDLFCNFELHISHWFTLYSSVPNKSTGPNEHAGWRFF